MPCIPSARDITSLYPEGTATIVIIAMNHVKKGRKSQLSKRTVVAKRASSSVGCGSPPSANEEAQES